MGFIEAERAIGFRHALACARDVRRIMIAAHRGKRQTADPEHAGASLRQLVENGSYIIEIDVSGTVDGVMVLHHDESLDRTTTGTGAVAEQPWNYVRTLYLRGPDGTPTTESPLSLIEFLEMASDRVFLMIDLKPSSSAREVVSLVNSAGMADAVAYIVYNDAQLQSVRAESSSALIATGANTTQELLEIDGNAPFSVVGLTGNLQTIRDRNLALRGRAQFFAAGTYLGDSSIDAMEGTEIGAFFRLAAEIGIQVLVSDDAFKVAAYADGIGALLNAGGRCLATVRI